MHGDDWPSQSSRETLRTQGRLEGGGGAKGKGQAQWQTCNSNRVIQTVPEILRALHEGILRLSQQKLLDLLPNVGECVQGR